MTFSGCQPGTERVEGSKSPTSQISTGSLPELTSVARCSRYVPMAGASQKSPSRSVDWHRRFKRVHFGGIRLRSTSCHNDGAALL